MDYINSVTLHVKTLREVCADTGASIPAGQVYGDWFPILPSAPPVAGDGQIVEPSATVKKAGKWYMGWAVRDMTPAELEQVAAQQREAFKAERSAAVENIKVTTAAGNAFDGDETSQGRMARAILGLQVAGEGSTVVWVLADNRPIEVGQAELTEALTLAGSEQARLWLPG